MAALVGEFPDGSKQVGPSGPAAESASSAEVAASPALAASPAPAGSPALAASPAPAAEPSGSAVPSAAAPSSVGRVASQPEGRSLPLGFEPLATRIMLGACVLAIAYLLVQIAMYRYGRDQGIYAVVADTMLRGGMPYRDAWDFKPPGIYLIYAFSRALLGSGQFAIRLVEVGSLVSLVAAFRVLARRFFGDARIGVLGGAFAILTYAELEFWHTAQPESFGAAVVAWALVLATREEPEREGSPRSQAPARPWPIAPRQLAAWAGAGALYGFAGLLKPPLAGCALVSAAFAAYRIRARGDRSFRASAAPFLAMGMGGTIVVGACALWFVARGAFSDMYETLFVFAPQYTKLSWVAWEGVPFVGVAYLAIEEWLTNFSSANLVGMLSAAYLPRVSDREAEGLLHVLGVVAVQLVGVAMQCKFFPYHFGAALPLAGFIAGLGAFKLWKGALRAGIVGVLAFAVGVFFAVEARTATRDTETDYWYRCAARQRYLFAPSAKAAEKEALDARLYSVADVNYGADVQVARFLAAHTAPTDPVFIWGFEPMIYDLAERAPASRYLYDVPQRTEWAMQTTRARLMQDLAARPPAAIVVEHRDVFPVVTGNSIDSADELRKFPELTALLAGGYGPPTRIEDFDIYLRR